MKLCVYGDSNAMGWDPRLGADVLDEALRFDSLIAKKAQLECVNDALEGRCIPKPAECEGLLRLLESADGPALLMLGTNDLLLGDTPSRMGRKWQAVLERCKEHLSGRVVLMTPPPMKDMNKAEKTALCKAYETAAQAYGLTFFDTVHLPMQLHFDQIHMLPEDHSLLAETLYPVVVRLIQEEKENAHH